LAAATEQVAGIAEREAQQGGDDVFHLMFYEESHSARGRAFRNLSPRVRLDGERVAELPRGFIGRDVVRRRPGGCGGLAAESCDEAIADGMRDPAAPRILPRVAPFERGGEGGVGNRRDDRAADLPRHDAGMVEVADLATEGQRHGHGGVQSPGFNLGFDLEGQGHPPALLGRQQPEIIFRVVRRRVPQLDLGVAPPLGQPDFPLVRSTERRLAQPVGDVFTHSNNTALLAQPERGGK
ncbi:MAG: hypothetical protein AN484_24630, partial [Aphanizomenon flos-aquae WA102]